MYRCVLQNLRLLPDPVIWAHVVPLLRKFCASPIKARGEAQMASLRTGEELRAANMKSEAERKKTLASARDVSCIPFRQRDAHISSQAL
jgi:hypothetical protein